MQGAAPTRPRVPVGSPPKPVNGLLYLDPPAKGPAKAHIDGLHPDLVPKLEALRGTLEPGLFSELRAVLVQYSDVFADSDCYAACG